MYDASDDAGSSRTDQPSAPTGPNLLPIPNMPGGYYDPATGDLYSNGQKVGGHYDAGSNTLTDPTGKTYTVGAGTPIPGAPEGANTGILTPTTTPPPGPGAPPPTTGGSGSGSGSGTGGPLPGAPTFTAPGYTPPPAFQAPPKFSYGDFVAPDPNDLNRDPTYQYELKTQQDQIQRSAAARGVLNTGGTIYDLLSNAHDLASTGYHDLWNRSMGAYQTNRANAFDTYKTNYGIGKDVYDTNYGTQYTDPYKYGYQGAQDSYNARQHNFDLGTQYSWYGKLFDFQKDQDAFDRKYRLLQYA